MRICKRMHMFPEDEKMNCWAKVQFPAVDIKRDNFLVK